jgi:hypothetical protein
MIVFATREGLPNARTSTGYRIENQVPFVALPADAALRLWVTVGYQGRAIRALVLDIGPHFEHDYGYVFGGGRPRAEAGGKDDYGRLITNRAGIDLGEKVWMFLGLTDNADVSWEFA